MLLQLFISLALLHIVHGAVSPCPNNTACLYLAKCLKNDKNVTVTMNSTEAGDWSQKNCVTGDDIATVTELFVTPISDDKWNFKMIFSKENMGIHFGDSLTMMANKKDATFKWNDDEAEIPFVKSGQELLFTFYKPEQKLLDIFGGSNITYTSGDSVSTHLIPEFWKRLVSCNPELIVDNCEDTEEKSCSKLVRATDKVTCGSGHGLWLKSENPEWRKLDTVTCEPYKDWQLTVDGNSLPEHNGYIRCSEVEPEPWTDPETTTAPGQESSSSSSTPTDKPSTSEPEPSEADDGSEATTKFATTSVLSTVFLPLVIYFARF